MIQHKSYEEFAAWMDDVRADALAGDQSAIAQYLNVLQRINPSFHAIVGSGAGCSVTDLLNISIKPFQYYRYRLRQPVCASQPLQHSQQSPNQLPA